LRSFDFYCYDHHHNYHQNIIIIIFIIVGLQHIYEAENGLEAVELVKKHHEDNNDFNFIITDNQMPVMDGITSVKLIREIGYKKTIIMITGNSIGEERAAMLENGIDHVLLKPIQKDEMFKILKL
jgi:CheY-like chemotaxis protein